MAAGLVFVKVVLLCTFATLTRTQSNRTVFSPSSSSGCTCDLTGNGCDVNCCCDPDCTSADQQAFTECKDTDTNHDDRVCLSNAALFTFRQNTQFKTETTGSGLFCIIRDNYESRNFYNDVQTASTSEEFSNLKSQSVSAVYDYRSEGTGQTTAASSYKVGDPVLLCLTMVQKDSLSFFKPLFGSECNDNNRQVYLFTAFCQPLTWTSSRKSVDITEKSLLKLVKLPSLKKDLLKANEDTAPQSCKILQTFVWLINFICQDIA
ncbi:unnamed protein product [Porites lobata]|uniref:Tectonic-1-3 N-terminal domain-containing protein n=1 Tax=Porites lobata TaxID=104759 RepID=A0ABN8QZC1_9CNID|nr:unnamed protein product [Porites lobata]